MVINVGDRVRHNIRDELGVVIRVSKDRFERVWYKVNWDCGLGNGSLHQVETLTKEEAA